MDKHFLVPSEDLLRTINYLNSKPDGDTLDERGFVL